MKIYNPFKKETYTSSFEDNFNLQGYKKHESSTEIQDLYYNSNKLIFVIKDEATRKANI